MDDPLSGVLDLLRLKGCVYFQREFHAPWAMRIENTGFAQFHAIVSGDCVVDVGGSSRSCAVGDVIVFPHGDPHVLADRPGRYAVPGPEAMASFNGPAPLFSSGERKCRIICGHYEYRSDIVHPAIGELPAAIHVQGLDRSGEDPVYATLRLMFGELARSEAGGMAVVERYSEILLIQVLRAHLRQATPRHGLLAAFADRRLAPAVALIHSGFAGPLSLDDLARAAALSRSSFAQRFRDVAGFPPIEYLTRWRMLVAGDLLRSAGLSVAQAAEQVGYESETAFARAFKKVVGTTPARYRRART